MAIILPKENAECNKPTLFLHTSKKINIKNQYKFIRSFISTATLMWNSALFGDSFIVYIANSIVCSTIFWTFKHILLLFGTHTFLVSLQHWINDVLMAPFFLVVWSWNKKRYASRWAFKSKSIFSYNCALGGMIIPAILYLCKSISSNRIWNSYGYRYCFCLRILMVRLSLSLKVFLVTLAVVDDLEQ